MEASEKNNEGEFKGGGTDKKKGKHGGVLLLQSGSRVFSLRAETQGGGKRGKRKKISKEGRKCIVISKKQTKTKPNGGGGGERIIGDHSGGGERIVRKTNRP